MGWTMDIADAVGDRMFYSGGECPTPSELGLGPRVKKWLSTAPFWLRLGVPLMLWILNLLPPLIIFRFSRYTKLSPVEQDLFLEKMLQTTFFPFRMTAFGVKMMFSINYWEEPEALKSIGYSGRCLLESGEEHQP
jgi:hypothetical protein